MTYQTISQVINLSMFTFWIFPEKYFFNMKTTEIIVLYFFADSKAISK